MPQAGFGPKFNASTASINNWLVCLHCRFSVRCCRPNSATCPCLVNAAYCCCRPHVSNFLISHTVLNTPQFRMQTSRSTAPQATFSDVHVDRSVVDPCEWDFVLLALLLTHECTVCKPPNAGWQTAHIFLRLLCLS